jgi:hypothetical protein
MGSEVRIWNPGGARFFAPVQTGPAAHLASYNGYRGLVFTTHSYLSPMLKKEYIYTSASSLGFRDLLRVKLYLYNPQSPYRLKRMHRQSLFKSAARRCIQTYMLAEINVTLVRLRCSKILQVKVKFLFVLRRIRRG